MNTERIDYRQGASDSEARTHGFDLGAAPGFDAGGEREAESEIARLSHAIKRTARRLYVELPYDALVVTLTLGLQHTWERRYEAAVAMSRDWCMTARGASACMALEALLDAVGQSAGHSVLGGGLAPPRRVRRI